MQSKQLWVRPMHCLSVRSTGKASAGHVSSALMPAFSAGSLKSTCTCSLPRQWSNSNKGTVASNTSRPKSPKSSPRSAINTMPPAWISCHSRIPIRVIGPLVPWSLQPMGSSATICFRLFLPSTDGWISKAPIWSANHLVCTTKVSTGLHITYAYMPCFTESTHQTSKSVPFYAPLRTLYPPFFRISFASESCSRPPCIVRFWSRLEVIAVAQWKRGRWQGNLIETTFLTGGHRCDGVHAPNGDKDAELIVDHLHCRSLKHWSCTIKILEIWIPEALHRGCTKS